MIIDLHIHSYYSADGRLSISELLQFYSSGDIVGLTDHETIGGWAEFKEIAIKKGVKPVLGVEWFLRNCCHIISYFVNDIPNKFIDFMAERRKREEHCMKLIYDKSKQKYSALPSYEEILSFKIHPENILGMFTLANSILKISGIEIKDVVDMLRDMRRDLPESDKPETFLPEDINKKIGDWNAIPVLAHPYKNSFMKEGRRHRNDVEWKVRELEKKGIKGVELFSDGSNDEELDHLLSLSRELNLVVSIGSDYHDDKKGLRPAALEKLEDRIKEEVVKWLNL